MAEIGEAMLSVQNFRLNQNDNTNHKWNKIQEKEWCNVETRLGNCERG